jgi:uncharacterized linocin/CFP29 family protein
MQSNPQVPWTEEQWVRVNLAIQEEAQRARTAAKFLPLYGPLPADADFVRKVEIATRGIPATPPPAGSPAAHLIVNDRTIIELATLQVKLHLRGAQLADPELGSVLSVFRQAANIIARVEDALIFNGQPGPDQLPPRTAALGATLSGGQKSDGLVGLGGVNATPHVANGDDLVKAVTDAVGKLETNGHFGPFAVALGQDLFGEAQMPNPSHQQVTPQEQIVPLLGGGSLFRCSAIPDDRGVVVALGGEPIELVIATDVSAQFLLLNDTPIYVFRVYEKLVLRIKSNAVVTLIGKAASKSKP